jgi:hypothetical protein
MIGSHNTFSYLPTKNIFKRWGRCQEVNYMTQYYIGVRCFDVRVKFDTKKKVQFGELERVQLVHNNITYQGGWSELNRFFAFVADDCWVRLILDIRKKPKDAEKQQELFVRLIDYARNTLGIKIAEAIVYWDWSYEVSPKLKITENHASVTNNVGIFKTPRMYAKKNNDLILSMNKEIADSENEVLLIDFVNLK